jgi:V/A-type H+-transporting ATPase subunit A
MSRALIRSISGPVLHATASGPFSMREAVRVGPQALLGEVVRLHEDDIVVQVYEDTTGLRPGAVVMGDGLPLAIRLGPGLLGNIFDGLLRPLSGSDSAFVAPGMRRAVAGRFAFAPAIAAGDLLTPGAVFGNATGASGRAQRCICPPDVEGHVTSIVAAGDFAETATVCTLRTSDGRALELAMGHDWPVRMPRPVLRRLPSTAPLVTGQRIIDCLFPVAQGGKAAVPGGFGTGKTVLLEALAKGCNADVIVYLGCGERGNELAGVLEEFPLLTDPKSGRPLMERTVIIANTSNMPVAAREASIYSAVTVAEYFRDQGIRPAAGPRRCARSPDVLVNFREKGGTPPTCRRGSPISTSARRSSIRWAATAARSR